jgi:hypothetical protein
MKSLIRTITVLAILNLTVTGLVLAQPAPAAPTPPEPAQVEATENALQEAQEQLKSAQKQMVDAQAQQTKVDKLMKDLYKSVYIGTGLPHGDSQSVLVIPSSEMKTEELSTIVEDMTVMARIIDSQLGSRESRRFPFSGDFLWSSSRTAETMYLQGYGALFLKKVDFPLSPTQQVQEEEKKPQKEDIDPIWAQTRQEIYEPQEDRGHREEHPEEKFDAEKVENLKTNIIKAMKHATNIRNLKKEESVILTITGSGDSSNAKILVSTNPTGRKVIVQNKELRTTGIAIPSLRTDSQGYSNTILIIRAKKADIDAFAKDELDLDKFRQRVQIFTQ